MPGDADPKCSLCRGAGIVGSASRCIGGRGGNDSEVALPGSIRVRSAPPIVSMSPSSHRRDGEGRGVLNFFVLFLLARAFASIETVPKEHVQQQQQEFKSW